MKNLRKFRKARGLTQQQLADMVGVSESAISQYEKGTKNPSFETALKIAEVLDCESADLVSERSIFPDPEDKKNTVTSGDGFDEKHRLVNEMFDQCSESDQILVIDFLKRLSQHQSTQDEKIKAD